MLKLYTFGLSILIATSLYSANLIEGDSSFEIQDRGPAFKRAAFETVNYRLDSKTAATGQKSLKVDFAQPDRLWSRYISLEPGKYTFSLYAKSDVNNFPAFMRVRAPQGEQFKKIVLNKSWERFSFSFNIKKGGICYLRFDVPKAGKVWLDGYQLEIGDNATPYLPHDPITVAFQLPSEHDFLFFKGEKLPVKLCVYNSSYNNGNKDLLLNYKITNFFGQEIQKGQKKINIQEKGRFECNIDLSSETLGIYILRASIETNGKVIAKTISTLGVVEEPEPIAMGIEPFCGVSCDSAFYKGIKRMGARWVQLLIPWKAYQPTNNTIVGYREEIADNKIIKLKNMGFNVSCTIMPHTPNWAVDPQELKESKEKKLKSEVFLPAVGNEKAFGDFVSQLVNRYKHYIDIYELGGEDNARFGQHSQYYKDKYKNYMDGTFVVGPLADRMAATYKEGIKAIRKLDGNKRIGLVRPTGVIRNRKCLFSKAIFKRLPNEFDIYPLDPYTSLRVISSKLDKVESPEDFLPEHYTKSSELTHTYANKQPLYTSEIGALMDIEEQPDSESARIMANYLAKSYLMTKLLGGLQCNWFITDDGIHKKAAYGLWFNGMPTAMVPAFSAVSKIVENVTEIKKLDLGRDVWAAVLRKPDGADAFIWLREGQAELHLGAATAKLKILDLMGNPVHPVTTNGQSSIQIAENPIYIRGNGKDAFDNISKLLTGPDLQLQAVKLALLPADHENSRLLIKNVVKKTINCQVNLSYNGKNVLNCNVKLAPDQSQILEFKTPALLADKKINVKAIIKFANKAKEQIAHFPIHLLPLYKLKKNIKIDGDISEWKDHPTKIVFDNEFQIRKPDWERWNGLDDLSATVYFGWDDTNFYMAAEVSDDKHFNNAKSCGYVWDGDAVQFIIDTKNDADLHKFSEWKKKYSIKGDDKNIGSGLAAKGTFLCAWADKTKLIEKESNLKVIRDEKNKKTFYELAVPWKLLGYSTVPENKVIGLGLVIFDDDDGTGQRFYYHFGKGVADLKDPGKFKKFLICQ